MRHSRCWGRIPSRLARPKPSGTVLGIRVLNHLSYSHRAYSAYGKDFSYMSLSNLYSTWVAIH